jgi:hypothetical protein
MPPSQGQQILYRWAVHGENLAPFTKPVRGGASPLVATNVTKTGRFSSAEQGASRRVD